MQRYAQLSGNTADVIIESETDPDGINGAWVACPDHIGPGWTTPDGGVTWAAPVPAPAPADPCEWLIDLGPFTDRLGPKAFLVDQSTDAGVVYIRNDLSRRKWVDLQDDRVAASLYYLAGHTVPVLGTLAVPILTDAEVAATLTTPVATEENRALRKLYF